MNEEENEISSRGKWVTINPYLNFSEKEDDKYSPEVWIVTDKTDPFDLPAELQEFDPKRHDFTVLREDSKEVWKGNYYDTTYVYTFTDDTFNYVIHETVEHEGNAYYAITRVRHHLPN